MFNNLLDYLTQRTYRVKIKSWGWGNRYYPQYKFRWLPFWFYFTCGEWVDVYGSEWLAWETIRSEQKRIKDTEYFGTQYKYEE